MAGLVCAILVGAGEDAAAVRTTARLPSLVTPGANRLPFALRGNDEDFIALRSFISVLAGRLAATSRNNHAPLRERKRLDEGKGHQLSCIFTQNNGKSAHRRRYVTISNSAQGRRHLSSSAQI